MKTARAQRGMGMLSLVYVLVTLALFGYVGLKLFPNYLEGVKVDQAISAVAKGPGAAGKSKKELAFAIVKRLDLDSSYRITERNWKQYLKISKKNDRVTINADYDAAVPLFMDISVVSKFSYSAVSN
jgi:hypothetical protein